MNFLQQARSLLAGRDDRWPPRKIALALQGGGSFGAFTWGVLDRLLEEPGSEIDAMSGASAGAVNGVLLASGLVTGGPNEAKARLARFWGRMIDDAAFVPFASLQQLLAGTPAGLWTRAFSPSQFNPFDLNPLRRALAAEVDFDALRDPASPRLLIATTRVRDSSLRIFRNEEITIDTVLASACLPLIHRTVEIEGESYWDGGYVANPPILPLVHENDVSDLVVVQVTPTQGARKPSAPAEIARRLDQISFNAPLNAELAALELARKLAATPKVRDLHVWRLAAEDEIAGLDERSAADLGRTFIAALHESGRRAAERWLAQPPALNNAA